ncbi:MAG: PAS domain S-box protein [Acetobacteraceae bacterium]
MSIRVHLVLFVLLAVVPAFALAWLAALEGATAVGAERLRLLREASALVAVQSSDGDIALSPRASRAWLAAIIGPDGQVSGGDAGFVESLSGFFADLFVNHPELVPPEGGILTGGGADGQSWRFAFSPLPGGSGFFAVAAMPEAAITAPLEANVVALLLSGGGVLFGTSLLIALHAARRLGGPIAEVERAARAFARGDPAVPPAGSGVGEVDALAETLARAAGERLAREAERLAIAARLEMVLATTGDAVLALDPAGKVIYLNRQAAAMLPAGVRGPGRAAAELWPAGPVPGLVERVTAGGGRARATGFDPDQGRWIEAEALRDADGITLFLRDVTQARALEEALRAGQARLQAVLDHLPIGVLLVGADGRLEFANRQAADLLGEPLDAGRLLATDLRTAALAEALAADGSARGEAWIRRRVGEDLLLRFAAAPLPASAGGARATVVAVTDLSEERRAADALRESEIRFRTLAEAVPQIVWSAAPEGGIDYVNPRFAEFTGLSVPSEAAPGGAATHPEDRDQARSAWTRALASGEPFVSEYRLRGAAGEWRWFSAQALPAREPGGRITRWIGAATDVTDLIAARVALENQVMAEAAARQAAVAAAEALAASEERFRRFAEASPDVLWIADGPGRRYDYVSPAFERIWGASRGDLLGNPRLWAASIHPDDCARVAEARGEGSDAPFAGFDCEYRILRPDGQERWIREIGFPVLDAAGRLARRGGFARDVTAAKQAEERQTLLIAELNHRVKNTLATVQSLALQTARGLATPSDPLRRFLAEFQARLLALSRAHDILTARTWSGAMLDEVIAAALSPWRPDDGVGKPRIEVEGGPPVWLPPKAVLGLSLGLHELATNALKHGSLTVPAGRVVLGWTSEPDQGVRLRWVERGGPPPKPPEHQGFGTRLLQRGLPGELGPGSTVAFTFLPEGLEAEIRFRAGIAPP